MAVFAFGLLSVAVEVIVWLPADSLATATFTWQDVELEQVLLAVPSMAIMIFDIPLASEAVVFIAKLPLSGTADPSAGELIVTSGGVVSFGVEVGVGVGVAVGFRTKFRFVEVSWNTDWSLATSWVRLVSKLMTVETFGFGVFALNVKLAT